MDTKKTILTCVASFVVIAAASAAALSAQWGTLANVSPGISNASGNDAINKSSEAHFHGNRSVHLRMWDDDGALLVSTWPGENGTLHTELSPEHGGKPISTDFTSPEPGWESLFPMLRHAPSDITIRIVDYRFPQVKLDTAVLQRNLDLPLEGNLSREKAVPMFGNVTLGAQVQFLGAIPIQIVAADEGTIHYRMDLNGTATFAVARSQGLNIVATVLPDGKTVRFTLEVPQGSFTAHKNCDIPYQKIRWGYYVLEEATPEQLVLSYYKDKGGFLLQNQTVTIELQLLGPLTEGETDSHHDDESTQGH